MSPFRLEISSHASERLKQRRITRAQLRNCISQGVLVGADINGRKIKQKRVGSKILVVVYLDILGGHFIVTAYWKEQFT